MTNFCLLSLIVYGVVVLIQVIQRRVLVGRWTWYFSGWRIPPVLGLTEGVFAFSFDDGEHQWLSSDFGKFVRSWTWQFLTSSQCLFTFWKSSSHGIFLWLRKLLEDHELIITESLADMLLEVFSWSRQTVVSLLFNIIDEKFLHIVTTNTYTILLICLTALLSKGISQIVRERRWQFSTLVFAWIVSKSLGGVEEGSAYSLVLFLSKKIISVIGDLFVEGLMQWEALALGEDEHLFGGGVVDRSVVFVWHFVLIIKDSRTLR